MEGVKSPQVAAILAVVRAMRAERSNKPGQVSLRRRGFTSSQAIYGKLNGIACSSYIQVGSFTYHGTDTGYRSSMSRSERPNVQGLSVVNPEPFPYQLPAQCRGKVGTFPCIPFLGSGTVTYSYSDDVPLRVHRKVGTSAVGSASLSRKFAYVRLIGQ